MNRPITDEDLARKVREEALIELARAAAGHERWSILLNFGNVSGGRGGAASSE